MSGDLFTDLLGDEIPDSQPLSLPPSTIELQQDYVRNSRKTPAKGTGQCGIFRSVEEIDSKYRNLFCYPFFNLVQSSVIDDALYSDKSMVVCAPTGSGKTLIFEMAIVQLLMDLETKGSTDDFKIIYMAPVKALCTERLTEWYSKYNKLGLLSIEVTGDTNVDFTQLQAYKIIITTPEKWDMLTRRWRDHRGLVEMIKLFLIDEVHILNDDVRGPVLEAVVSRMKTVEASAQSAHRIEKLQKQYQQNKDSATLTPSKDIEPPRIRFVAVSATVNNPEDVAAWLGNNERPAVYYKFGDECRPVKLNRIVEGYPCSEGTSIFKFDIILSYKLWSIIQKYYNGKPTLIFCNTRKSVVLTAETLSREITITFSPEQKAKLTALASTIKNKKLQSLVLAGVGCHHAGMLYEERVNIELAFRNRDLPILVTTTTLAMGVNLPAHLVIIKNTQQYVNGAYQEYSISTVLQMVGRAGRPQFDNEATAVIMTRQKDKARYQALVSGSEPLQSYLHKRLAENLNSEAALGTVGDVAQCVQWLRSTFLYVRAAKDPKRYLGLPQAAPVEQISKKIEEMCVRAMNGLASSGLITMDEASCIESTEAGRLMSVYYLDLETMKLIMKIQGNENLERLLNIICECHELADMHLRVDERRCLNSLNRNNVAATIRFPMKGKINSRQMKLNCVIQAVLGCLPISEPSLNQEAMKVMRIVQRICKCLVAYVTRPEVITQQRQCFSAVLNSVILAKCVEAHLWENSPYISKQMKGIGPTFSTLLASAGKVNISVLEESHPRDLERIMNKGPPAGNVLKKQVSLLPKYQLTTNPIDERTVSVRLMLLNQAYLAENMDHLTAGDAHKCYIIAGDSENHILLLTTFKDKHLISVYDGTMTYEITRKHIAEHKIFIHCISSTFVGIDVLCEYTFKTLLPSLTEVVSTSWYDAGKNTSKKQLNTATDRKRKLSNEITHSKEKKKRENNLAENIRILKESFSKVSNEIKMDMQKTEKMSKSVLNQIVRNDKSINLPNNINFPPKFDMEQYDDALSHLITDDTLQDDEFKYFMDSEKIDTILNEIESEITSASKSMQPNVCGVITSKIDLTKEKDYKNFSRKDNNVKKRNNTKNLNNNFLNLLEKNVVSSDEEESFTKENGFANAIKTHVEKFLRVHQDSSSTLGVQLEDLCIESDFNKSSFNESRSITNKSSDNNNFSHNIVEIITPKEPENYLQSCFEHDKGEIICCRENNVTGKPSNLIYLTIKNKQKKTQSIEISESPLEYSNKSALSTSNVTDEKQDKNKVAQETFEEVCVSPKFTELKQNKILQFDKKLPELPTIDSQSNYTSYLQNEYTISDENFEPLEINKSEFNILSKPDQIKDKELGEQKASCKNWIPEEIVINKELVQYKSNFENNKRIIQSRQYYLPLDNKKSDVDGIQSPALKSNLSSHKSCSTQDVVMPTFKCLPSFDNYGTENKQYGDQTMKQNKEHMNKHSFSAEKIDVHTKFASDRQLCIVRRLKLDVDVTEIIHKSTPENNYKIYDKQSNKILITNDNLAEQLKLTYKRSNESELVTEKDDTLSTVNSSNGNLKLYSPTSNEATDKLNIDENIQEITNTERNVETILQKYSHLLRDGHKKALQNYTREAQPTMKNIKTVKKINLPKKPFRISDLQNINIPIANICDPPKPVNIFMEGLLSSGKFKNTTATAVLQHHLDKNKETSLINNYTAINKLIPTDEDIECNDNIMQSGFVENINEFSQSDFNIDNSMLDPKMLLKSIYNDDDIVTIPPPPDFADELYSYSPELNDESNLSELSLNYSFEATDDLDSDNVQKINDVNRMFDFNTTLTPDAEIETWTLSRDENSEKIHI